MELLSTKKYNFLLGRMYFTGNVGFQNMLVHQPTFSMLQLKEDKGTDYVISWISKGVYSSNISPLHTIFFFHSIKLSRYRIGIKFDNESLIVEQNSYTSKIVNLTLSMT